MYSDTHFHLQHLSERGIDIGAVLQALADRDCRFALDIGTRHDDLRDRLALAASSGTHTAHGHDMLHFSAGIWPSADAISHRDSYLSDLQEQLTDASVVAIGECGLDHHWNPAGADHRCADDFDEALLRGEAELFESQLTLARSLSLPVIVHSRDAFDGTLSCIANVGYDRGIIHCYSYGIAEARAFLDRGWYLSFSGAITYTKASRLADMTALLAFVPRDRLLIETDAPYLAPHPFRGQTNTPVFVEQVYRFAADRLGMTAEALSTTVDQNAATLFGVPV